MLITKLKLQLLVLTSFIFGFSINAITQETLFFDDFESGGGNWTLNADGYGENKWIINNVYETTIGQTVPDQPSSITNNPNSSYLHIYTTICLAKLFGFCILQPGVGPLFETNTASMRKATMNQNVSTIGKSGVKFSFYYVIHGDIVDGWEAHGKLAYSTNDGANWSYLPGNQLNNEFWNSVNATSTWSYYEVSDVNFDNQATLKFQFEWKNTSGLLGIDPPFSIDDVLISYTSDDTPPTTSITNVSASEHSWCKDEKTINVNFTATGTFNTGNEFVVELSDASGSFNSPTQIGTLASTSGGNLTATATIPNSIPTGTGYRIRVRSTNEATTSDDNGTNIIILPVPEISIPTMPSVCVTSNIITIPNFTPSGGTYSGTGVVNGNQFNPQTAGVGDHEITYTVTNSSNCTSTDDATITVTDAPTASIVNVPTSVCASGGVITLEGSPSGGTFSGNGVTGNQFDPTAVTSGSTVAINYSVNITGCGDVSASPTAPLSAGVMNGVDSLCNGSGTKFVVIGGASGGTWGPSSSTIISVDENGNGTSHGPGQETITYTVSDPLCGAQVATHNIVISNPPSAGTVTNDNLTICLNEPYTLSSTTSNVTWTIASQYQEVATITANGVVTTHKEGVATVTYTADGIGGCSSDTKTVEITVVDSPTPQLSGDKQLCQGSTLNWTVDIANGVWKSEHTNIATVDQSGNITGISGGKATITYTVTTTCTRIVGEEITISPLPNAGAVSGPLSLNVGASGKLTPTQSTSDKKTWVSQNPEIATVDDQGNVKGESPGTAVILYIVENECGVDTAEIKLLINGQGVVIPDIDIKIPSAFSPDNDNLDDIFVIVGLEKYPGTIVDIYNQWGNLVYHSDDYKNDWDGNCQDCMLKKGGLPTGTYYYVIDVTSEGIKKNYKGFIYLER